MYKINKKDMQTIFLASASACGGGKSESILDEVRAIIGNYYSDNRIIMRKGKVIAVSNKIEGDF